MDAFRPRQDKIRAMVSRAMTNFTSKPTVAEAWRSLVSAQDFIGIKVVSGPGARSGTRPSVVAAVVEGLLAAGLPPRHIIVWDKQISDLKNAGYSQLSSKYGIRLAGSAQAGYDPRVSYDTAFLGIPVWGDLEFGRKGEGVGRKSYLSKLVTQQMTRIVNITPLLNHNLAGVSGSLWSLAMGSVDNTIRFENDADRLAAAVPEIIALPSLGDRVVLNIVDALLCQYQGEEQGLLHYSTALNELRLSQDPLALDLLSLQELDWQRKAAHVRSPTNHMELYQNAALLDLGAPDLSNVRIERVR